MNKRNHPLTIGEIVFDIDVMCFGVLVKLENGVATIDMNGIPKDKYNPNVPCGWCEMENKFMFDEEITENELMWTTDNLDNLYQVAWGVKDTRTENLVCYEHNNLEDEYPYYSPYLNENLFSFEVNYC